jgi:hypothetical protein
LTGQTEFVVRQEKDSSKSRFRTRIWALDGTLLVDTVTVTTTAVARRTVRSTNALIRPSAQIRVAWLRLYSTVARDDMPASSGQTGDLGSWEFEGNLSDSSGNGRTMSFPGVSFVSTPVPAFPVLQADVTSDGEAMTLDAGKSFTYDGQPIKRFRWQWVSGPAAPQIVTQEEVTTRVTGLIDGVYTFRLTATTEAGAVFTKEGITTTFASRGLDGLTIQPSNTNIAIARVAYPHQLPTGQRPAHVHVEVRKPDGRTLAPVKCMASPCEIRVDNRHGRHSYRLTYFNAAGAVLGQSSEWQPLSIPRVLEPEPWRDGSWRKFASYIAQNGAHVLGAEQSEKSTRLFARKLFWNVGGRNPGEFNSSFPASLRYIDAQLMYPGTIPAVRAFAEKYGYDYEDMFLHFNKNHSWSLSPDGGGGAGAGWTSAMARFDGWDPNGVGVFTSDGGTTLVNAHAAAWTGSITMSASTKQIYIGSIEPFDDIYFDVTTGRLGGSLAWEYWNGASWMPTASAVDSTDGLAKTGRLRFVPRPDWTRRSMQAGHAKKYWMRVTLSTPATWPVIAKIYGDAMRTGSINVNGYPRYYGWCATDADKSRINTGLSGEYRSLEYDPTPPSDCQARFRHQGRALTTWMGNAIVKNVGNVQQGIHTWSHFSVEDLLPALAPCPANNGDCGWKGIFFDDIHDLNTKNLVEPPARDECATPPNCSALLLTKYTELTTGAWIDVHHAAMYADTTVKLHAICPECKTSGNIGTFSLAKYGDFALSEIGQSACCGTSYQQVDGHKISFDQFRTDRQALYKNLNVYPPTQGIFAFSGTTSEWSTATSWQPFDRGNRGPINALAIYYIHANENTIFFYTGYSSPAWYDGKDNFFFWNATPDAVVGAERPKDTTTDTKTIDGDFSAVTWIPNPPATVRVRFGDKGEFLNVWKVSNAQLGTSSKIWNDYPVGTGLWRINEAFLSVTTPPPPERISHWGYWFPAMNIEMGVPDTNGWNKGNRWGNASAAGQERNGEHEWIRPTGSGGIVSCSAAVTTVNAAFPGCTKFTDPAIWRGIIRRDFTRATMLHNLGWNLGFSNTSIAFANTYSAPFGFSDSRYAFPQPVMYPLRADGMTDNAQCNYTAVGGLDYRTEDGGCTAIRLRAAESVILMRQPIR